MPVLSVFTNVSASLITSQFLKCTTELVSQILDKPYQSVFVQVLGDQQLSKGGDERTPCGYAVLRSIGKLDSVSNIAHSAQLCRHFEQHLAIATNRMAIFFENYDAGFVGTTCTTKAELLKQK